MLLFLLLFVKIQLFPPSTHVYIEKFKNLTHTKNLKVKAIILSTDDDFGMAYYNKSLNIIYLNRHKWFNLSYFQQEQLILHELGHSEFGLKDIKQMMLIKKDNGPVDRCPVSIMSLGFNDMKCLDRYRFYYYNEYIERVLSSKDKK